jgi:hypothetical protein
MRQPRRRAPSRTIVPSLAELQTRIRDALVLGAVAEVAPLLVGGREPTARLAIHRRHYEASLVEAVLRRFPAVIWLAGDAFTRAAAADFVCCCPPAAPCIAEYAEGFPAFLARRAGAGHIPYLSWLARLEWHLGPVALAIAHPACGMEELSRYEAHRLPDLVLGTQPGLRYLEAPWPVDELIGLYVTEAAPEHYALEPLPVRLQISGARGSFRIDRLDVGTFAFRSAVAGGLALGEAAERALEADPNFDPGRGLAALIADGLATGAVLKQEGPQP